MTEMSDGRTNETVRKIGEATRRLSKAARDKAEEKRPEAERLLRRAREAAKPAAERATQFAKEHEDEIRGAANVGARYAISRATPLPLQPVIATVAQDMARPKPAKPKPENAKPQNDAPADGDEAPDPPLIF